MNLTKKLFSYIAVNKQRLLASGFEQIQEDVFTMADLTIYCTNNKFYNEGKQVKNMLQVANYVYGRK